MTLVRDKITAMIVAALVAMTLVLAGPAPAAKADHYGPYVANREALGAEVLIRDHTWGTKYWQGVPSGTNSRRGAIGVFVYPGYKIYYESIQTGARYWSHCGQEYTRLGYVGPQNKPYLPVPPDRSIKILDFYQTTACHYGPGTY